MQWALWILVLYADGGYSWEAKADEGTYDTWNECLAAATEHASHGGYAECRSWQPDPDDPENVGK